MTDIHGRQFTRPTQADFLAYYYIGGNAAHRNIPFRVCGNSTHCNLFQNEYVPEAGKWYLQDQAGSAEKLTAGFVGVNPSGGTRWWLVKTESAIKNDQASIAGFTATLKCLFGKCTPCVRLQNNTSSSPVGRLGIIPLVATSTEEAPLGEAFILVKNNNTCFPIIFQETTCVARR